MPPRKNKNHTRWQGAIQAITVSIALLLCAGLAYLTILGMLPIYDAILLGETLLAFAIALICSHAYNYYPGTEKEGSLREEAAKLKAMWLHANFSWNTISIWMTITPLYCTCATIYISGSSIGGEWDQVHVLVYSILSLVLSLGVYVLRPSNRATGYREAYLSVTIALTNDPVSEPGAVLLRQAIIKGEQSIAKQDTLDPK